MTTTLSLFAGIDDSVNSVVLPFPVKLLTSFSFKSKFSIVFAMILPQKISFTVGAVLNTILWLSSNANPSVNVNALTLGLWITLLIATFNWVALFNLAAFPFPCVNLNFVLTPSNEAVSVWEVPPPVVDKFMTVLLFAFAKFVANLIVFALSNET